jgi:hypothetical protein
MSELVYELPSHKVSISLIMDVVTRSSHGITSLDSLTTYTGKTANYIKSAICAGKLFDLIGSVDKDSYKTRVRICVGREL